ncbi:MAG: hypothetical protein AAB263_04710 [Planctomycetota bacterium]
MATALVVIVPFCGGESTSTVAVNQVAKPPPVKVTTTTEAKPSSGDAAIAWVLPQGWSVLPTKPMRLASFAVVVGETTGECGVSIAGGAMLDNINRWRGQVGIPPIKESDLGKELRSDTCAFGPFSWLALRGDSRAFFAAIIATPSGQCFVKLEAPGAKLDAFNDCFLTFCRSLHPATAP